MLRVAVPNKGALAPGSAQMLREAGYRQRTDDKDLTCRDPDNDVEFFYLRPRDIATYVGSGDLDLGITGRDLLVDAGAAVDEVLDLDFGGSTFRFAALPGRYATLDDLADARIATAYPGVVERFLTDRAIKASGPTPRLVLAVRVRRRGGHRRTGHFRGDHLPSHRDQIVPVATVPLIYAARGPPKS